MAKRISDSEFKKRAIKALELADKEIAKEAYREVLKGFDNEYGYEESFDEGGVANGKKVKWEKLGTTPGSVKYVNTPFSKGGRSGKYHPILNRTGKLRKSIILEFTKNGFNIKASGDREKISEYNSDRPHINEPGFLYKHGGRLDKLYEKYLNQLFDELDKEGLFY